MAGREPGVLLAGTPQAHLIEFLDALLLQGVDVVSDPIDAVRRLASGKFECATIGNFFPYSFAASS